MRKVFFAAGFGGLLFMFATACGGGGTGGSGNGSTGTGNSGNTGNGSCPDNLAEAPNSEFCDAIKTTPQCQYIDSSYHSQVCGVAVLDPTVELARVSSTKDYAGSGPPDLGCMVQGSYPTAGGASQTVTMKGLVKLFSNGCETKNVDIQVFTVTDGELSGSPVGTPVTTPADCKTTGEATEDANCGTRYECPFTYDGVPSETELVIVTKGTDWKPLYDYNIYILTSEVSGGVWTHNVKAVANDDYTAIPQLALGGPITEGNGAVAGEVHDCGDVRLQNATVGIDVDKGILTYFTDDELHPLPQTSSTSTSVLGLWAALDVPPGKASVAALGLVDGKVTTVGYQRIQVFPNSITAVSFHGVRPYQVAGN